MGNYHNQWYNEFEGYEQDLNLTIEKGRKDDDADFSFMDIDFDKDEQEEKPAEPEKPAFVPEPEPVGEQPAPEEPQAEEAPAPPRHVHPPLNANDMTLLSMKLEGAIAAVTPLRDQALRMVREHDDLRLPKGLRTTAANLYDICDILVATKALIDIYLEMGVEPLYQSVDDSRLKTDTNSTVGTLLSHIPTMQEGLNDVETTMNEGSYDRPSANLRIRIVKGQTKVVKDNALQQAKALVQTTEAFPLEYGSLRLLCLFNEKGDNEMNMAIDSALRLGEAVQVPVADAPAMLHAVKTDNQEAVTAILRRMVDNGQV